MTLLREVESESDRLSQVQFMEIQLNERQLHFNRHCTATPEDVVTQWTEYTEILNIKKPLLEQELEFQATKGITADQLAKISQTFAQYDWNRTGALDRKELQSCLYSLGEDVRKRDVDAYMRDYGTTGGIDFAHFKDLMMKLVGIAGTRDQLHTSFRFISRDRAHVVESILRKILSADDVAYLLANMGKLEGGLDYSAWLTEAFAR